MLKLFTSLKFDRIHQTGLMLVFVILFGSVAVAQKHKQSENEISAEPVAKIEIPIAKDDRKIFQFTLLENKKLALVTEENGEYNVSMYDQDLRKLSSVNVKSPNEKFKMSQKLNIGEKFYFLFTDNRRGYVNSGTGRMNFRKFAVVQVDLASRKQTAVEGDFEKTFTMENFTESNGKIILVGTNTISTIRQYWRGCYTFALLYIPLLFGSMKFPNWVDIAVIDFAKKKCTIETPESDQKQQQELLASNFSGDKGGCVVIRKKISRKKYTTDLYPVAFGNSISLKDPINLNPGEKNTLFSFKINNNSNQNRIAVGTYGPAKRSYVEGFYLSEVSDRKVIWENTITLDQLFKKEAKKAIKEKTNVKGAKTAKVKVSGGGYSRGNSFYLFHNVMESENEYLFAAESYYPTYHLETRSSYVNGKWTTTTVYVFDGYVYEKGIIFCTSKKGKLIWTNTFDLPYYRTFIPTVELMNVDSKDDQIVANIFRFPYNRIYTIDESGNVEEGEFNAAKISTGGKVKTTGYSALYWYDDFYVVDGFSKSKKSKSKTDNSEKSSQYYIYKMEIGKEMKEEE